MIFLTSTTEKTARGNDFTFDVYVSDNGKLIIGKRGPVTRQCLKTDGARHLVDIMIEGCGAA